jgi:hypothetical protein
MTLITFQDGTVVVRDGKVGTEQACCCGCCLCSAEDPPFIDAVCGLQSVIFEFDLSQFGTCTGAATVEVTADDQDLGGIPWTKQQSVETANGFIIIEAYISCEFGCLVAVFNILPGPADGTECDFCQDFGSIGASLPVSGITNEDGICCPVGATGQFGPNIPFCDNADVEFSVAVTYVY